MKRIAVVMCSLVLLSACSGGDETPVESSTSQAGSVPDAITKDPVAVCETLLSTESDGPVERLRALDGVVVTEAGVGEVEDLRQELVALVAKSPTELGASIQALRAPLDDVTSQVASGAADVVVDSAAVETATTEATATCEEAGYTVPAA